MSRPDSSGPSFAIAAGARMGTYEILSPLGVGGMGEVYRARDTRLGREVALRPIRVNKAQDQTARERIEREARIVASLHHPNILALHDIGTTNGAMNIVTELVDGESLRGLTPPLRKCLDDHPLRDASHGTQESWNFDSCQRCLGISALPPLQTSNFGPRPAFRHGGRTSPNRLGVQAFEIDGANVFCKA
jgi:serine/threonine protein kinase